MVPRVLGVRPRVLGVVPSVLGVVPGVLGVASTVLGVAHKVLRVAPRVLGVAHKVLGVAPRVLGVAPRVLGVASRVLGVVPGALGVAPMVLGVAPWVPGKVPTVPGVAELLPLGYLPPWWGSCSSRGIPRPVWLGWDEAPTLGTPTNIPFQGAPPPDGHPLTFGRIKHGGQPAHNTDPGDVPRVSDVRGAFLTGSSILGIPSQFQHTGCS